MSGMRPALLGTGAGEAELLHVGLYALGLPSVVVRGTGTGLPVAEALLRRRGFVDGLTGVPGVVRRLTRADPALAHAFSPGDALAAALWRRRSGGPVAFTCTEVIHRANVADRRLRLELLRRALDGSDAVRSASEEVRAALERWAAVDAPVLAPGDAAGHAALYAGLRQSPRTGGR